MRLIMKQLMMMLFCRITNPEAGRPVRAGVWSGLFDGRVPTFFEGV